MIKKFNEMRSENEWQEKASDQGGLNFDDMLKD